MTTLKTGDIFYFDNKNPSNDEILTFKCRILFIGEETIFYDYWWNKLNKWSFVPTTKNLSFYQIELNHLKKLDNLKIEGFEIIDQKKLDKLYVHLPEFLIKFNIDSNSNENIIDLDINEIAFIPIGPNQGTLKPVIIEINKRKISEIVNSIQKAQNFEFLNSKDFKLKRVGLHKGLPSYILKNNCN
ncbi:hypothetical protein OBJ95_13015 [Empedobacter falsenii]